MTTATRPASASPLREARLSRGLTLNEVATAAGISVQHLSNVENGRKRLSLPVLKRVLEVLGDRGMAVALGQYLDGGRLAGE